MITRHGNNVKRYERQTGRGGARRAARRALSVAAASLPPFPRQGEARKALAAVDT